MVQRGDYDEHGITRADDEPGGIDLRRFVGRRPLSMYVVPLAGVGVLGLLLAIFIISARGDEPPPITCLPVSLAEGEAFVRGGQVDRISVLTERGKPETGPLAVTLNLENGSCRRVPAQGRRPTARPLRGDRRHYRPQPESVRRQPRAHPLGGAGRYPFAPAGDEHADPAADRHADGDAHPAHANPRPAHGDAGTAHAHTNAGAAGPVRRSRRRRPRYHRRRRLLRHRPPPRSRPPPPPPLPRPRRPPSRRGPGESPRRRRKWLSAIGYRLSAIGYRLSAIGYRLSALGSS